MPRGPEASWRGHWRTGAVKWTSQGATKALCRVTRRAERVNPGQGHRPVV